jgi:hypothetical protein
MPLSSVNASRSADPKGPGYWRPDLGPEDSQITTTVYTTTQDSRTSSQEDLNPKESGTFLGLDSIRKVIAGRDAY